MHPSSTGEFRDAGAEAAHLHAKDELFARTVVPEPAAEEPVGWAMLGDTAEHDDTDEMGIESVHDEPELIDLPAEPGPSHPPWSNLVHCIALRQLHGRCSR